MTETAATTAQLRRSNTVLGGSPSDTKYTIVWDRSQEASPGMPCGYIGQRNCTECQPTLLNIG